MALDLNHKVFGFVSESNLNSLKRDLEEMDLNSEDILILSAEEAVKAVDVKGEHSGLMDRVRLTLQRWIGGGPSEFLRDVQLTDQYDYLVGVLAGEEDVKEKVAEVFKRNGVHHIKFFHPMYVEHLTVEPGHRQMSKVSKQTR